MCGIIGYTGHRPAVPVIMEGLSRLEYRGYDSSGLAFIHSHKIEVVKAEGKLAQLENKLSQADSSIFTATTGIGHTRWATHGLPVERNAHPHCDAGQTLAMVHNGIIENFQELKTQLALEGLCPISDTDTEILALLIGHNMKKTSSILEAMAMALKQAEGSFAITLIDLNQPNYVYGARRASPLLMGVGVGENFLASDIPAFLPYTREVVFLEDDEIAVITPNTWQVLSLATLSPTPKTVNTIAWDVESAQKGGFKHFMLKEIFEQPRVVSDCLSGRLDPRNGQINLPELAEFPLPERLHILACGTSYHAGMLGAQLFEDWARIPAQVEIASEFRYRNAVLDPKGAVLVISQSGETADTLAGLRLAKKRGLSTLGLCNVLGSSIAREAASVIYTQAGPEISVASTKAMCSQLVLLVLMALYWGQAKGTLNPQVKERVIKNLADLPALLESHLPAMRARAAELAKIFSEAQSFMFLGRGWAYPLALEGALKLKEISYIHAEGYAAGEMKHGPIALINPHFPAFVLAFDDDMLPKIKANIQEVQARGGRVIALTQETAGVPAEYHFAAPYVYGPMNALTALPALQLFAYEMADFLGKDVDQPRNLAKSVTVE